MRRRLVTINVVAAEAGVSASTVSRVLNGRAGQVGISLRLRERVYAAAERLQYAPNHAAQSLARQQTGIITLLRWRPSDSLCPDLAAGIAAAAHRHGYQLSVVDIGAPAQPLADRTLRHLASGTCDGVIDAPGSNADDEHDGDALTALIDQGMTVVLMLDRTRVLTVPSVDVDHATGTYRATKHLLALGHRRIAHFTSGRGSFPHDDLHPPGARYRGYRSALAEAGLEAEPGWLFRGCPTSEGGRGMLYALAERFPGPTRRPTAVVAFNDEIAIGVLRGAYEIGLRVPEEIAVIGFGGTSAARFTVPALTTVEYPCVEMGERAAEALVASLDGRAIDAREQLVPVTLAIRESCGIQPRPHHRCRLHQGGDPAGQARTSTATTWWE